MISNPQLIAFAQQAGLNWPPNTEVAPEFIRFVGLIESYIAAQCRNGVHNNMLPFVQEVIRDLGNNTYATVSSVVQQHSWKLTMGFPA